MRANGDGARSLGPRLSECVPMDGSRLVKLLNSCIGCLVLGPLPKDVFSHPVRMFADHYEAGVKER